MKLKERYKAIELRKQGLTYPEIQDRIHVSKASLSYWLRDIPYVPTELTKSRRKIASIRTGQMLHNRKLRRVIQIMVKAKKEISSINNRQLKLLGVMAYWAEGSKTQDNLVQFTNSDPKIIKFVLKWLKESCGVSPNKLHFHLHAHPDVNEEKSEKYWSKITNIPLSQFHKTTAKISGSSGRRYNKLENGVATITVCDTNLHYRIKGWIEGLFSSANS